MDNQNQDKGPLYRTIQDDIDEAQAKQAPSDMTPEEQARQLLALAQQKKLEEFHAKLQALCAEYKVTLQVQQNIVVVPNTT